MLIPGFQVREVLCAWCHSDGGPCSSAGPNIQSPSVYSHPSAASHDQSFHFPSSHLSSHAMSDSAHEAMSSRSNGSASSPHSMPGQEFGSLSPHTLQHNSKTDEDYWKTMFIEIGFGAQGDPATGMTDDMRPYPDGRYHIPPHPIHASPPSYGP